MNQVEMEVLGEEVNAVVIRHPSRRFPGVLIQGDTLHILSSTALLIVKALNEGSVDEALGEAQELSEVLAGHLAAYERAMRREGLALPYVASEPE
ncbi:hypothetical protein JYT28_01105 [Desulfobulbus sp. AH-315-M07]|nr:hypothetical protein [Desulfobulbus sp. AH-315-M07]